MEKKLKSAYTAQYAFLQSSLLLLKMMPGTITSEVSRKYWCCFTLRAKVLPHLFGVVIFRDRNVVKEKTE